MEIEEFKRAILACAGLNRRKDDEAFKGLRASSKGMDDDAAAAKLVCVTSGLSFLGLAVVNRLLACGYSVRVLVDNKGQLLTLSFGNNFPFSSSNLFFSGEIVHT